MLRFCAPARRAINGERCRARLRRHGAQATVRAAPRHHICCHALPRRADADARHVFVAEYDELRCLMPLCRATLCRSRRPFACTSSTEVRRCAYTFAVMLFAASATSALRPSPAAAAAMSRLRYFDRYRHYRIFTIFAFIFRPA